MIKFEVEIRLFALFIVIIMPHFHFFIYFLSRRAIAGGAKNTAIGTTDWLRVAAHGMEIKFSNNFDKSM